MNTNAVKEALSSLLGLPKQLVVEGMGGSIRLSSLAFAELSSLVNLPDGYKLTPNIGSPAKGEYFLDLDSLVSDERVVIYRATGTVKSINVILKRYYASPKKSSSKVNFDFLVCMLQGGQAFYRGTVVNVIAPIVDTKGRVAVLSDGLFKLVRISELDNGNPPLSADNAWDELAGPTTYSFGQDSPDNPKNPHHKRFDIKFDNDEDIDPFYGLN